MRIVTLLGWAAAAAAYFIAWRWYQEAEALRKALEEMVERYNTDVAMQAGTDEDEPGV